MKNLKFFLLISCFIILAFAIGCSDSFPVVSCAPSNASSTSETITPPCTSSDTSTSATITSARKIIFPNAHGSLQLFTGEYYVPIEGVNTFSENLPDPTALPEESAYNTDKSFVHVKEPPLSVLSLANEIACKVEQTQYQTMTNKGEYKVLIDANQCTSFTDTPRYEFLTVNSIKDDETSLQTVNAWIHQESDHDKTTSPSIVKVELFKTDTSSAYSSKIYNTYGIKNMYFEAYSEEDTFMFKGYLTSKLDYSNQIVTQFYQKNTFDNNYESKAIFVEDIDGAYGNGTVSRNNFLNIAYNSTHFLMKDDNSDETCLSKNNTIITVKKYAVYNNEYNDEPGSRLNINFKSPVKYEDYYYDDLYIPEQGQNQLMLLKNMTDNNYMTLHAPKEFLYIHTQTDSTKPDFKYNGTTFTLRYNGFGYLTGLPGKCINLYTGKDADCFNSRQDNQHIIWINDLIIPDGSTVSDATDFYYIKAVEKEKIMTPANISNCNNIDLTVDTYTLPDETLWENFDLDLNYATK